MTNRELHNLELYYAGCRNAKRDSEKGYLEGFNDYRKGETTMENKLTANEKKLLKAYAISLANAASNYERLGYGTEREKEFFDNYSDSKDTLFMFINSL